MDEKDPPALDAKTSPYSGKPTLAFIDHAFHKKTRSGDFLRELFSSRFVLTDFWIDPWVKNKTVAANVLNAYDCVFFFQRILPIDDLRKITKPILWAQMYDSANTDYFYWKNLAQMNIKALCFSRKVFALAQKYGVPSAYFQYYKNPAQFRASIPETGRHFWFWHRGTVSFDEVKRVLDPRDVDSLAYMETPDPNFRQDSVSSDDRQRYHMKIYEHDFLPHEQYLALVSQANIFVAPRKKEGIGMSFVEALAMGQVVIGWNDATMNEYLRDGYSGYLFDETTDRLDLSNISDVMRNSRREAREGYERWRQSIPRLLEFVLSPPRKKPRRPVQAALFGMLYRIKLWQYKMRMRYFGR